MFSIIDLLFFNFWFVALVVGSSVWVAVDASNLGVRKGMLKGGFFDMGVVGWFFSCLLLWIIGFPGYLFNRAEYKRLNDGEQLKAKIKSDPAGQIRKLAELKQVGALTDAEYEAKKKELLSRI